MLKRKVTVHVVFSGKQSDFRPRLPVTTGNGCTLQRWDRTRAWQWVGMFFPCYLNLTACGLVSLCCLACDYDCRTSAHCSVQYIRQSTFLPHSLFGYSGGQPPTFLLSPFFPSRGTCTVNGISGILKPKSSATPNSEECKTVFVILRWTTISDSVWWTVRSLTVDDHFCGYLWQFLAVCLCT